MSFHQKENPVNERNLSDGIQENILISQHEMNVTDGSEFLDDAIRTKDQPLKETTMKKNE
jgi:hypothetical protein